MKRILLLPIFLFALSVTAQTAIEPTIKKIYQTALVDGQS